MFRFSIRDVLWLTVVVALAVGWWIDRGRLAARAESADAMVSAARAINEDLQTILTTLVPDWHERARHWDYP